MIYRSTTNTFYFTELAVLTAMLLRTSVLCNMMLCHLRFLEFINLTLLISIAVEIIAFLVSQTA
jgi:hypothetical protein